MNPLSSPAPSRLQPVSFEDLPGFSAVGLREAWKCFAKSSEVLSGSRAALRPALAPPSEWASVGANVTRLPAPVTDAEAERLFRAHFDPFRIHDEAGAFFTGYYEPEVEGALRPSENFAEPILARPSDLETFERGCFPLGQPFSAGRRGENGVLSPYSTRSEIEMGGLADTRPIVWLRDAVDAYKVHVQGSGRVRIEDGSLLRLTYAGRNGHSYTSIGKLLVERGEVLASEVSPDAIYGWIRVRGQRKGEPGRLIMQCNASYIFFSVNRELAASDGPIGAASTALTPLRSIAVDRRLWPYGLPYWIDGNWLDESGANFRRMMVGQDTGSAILGPSRADLFFGAGEAAGRLAGEVRHSGRMFVLLPRAAAFS